MYNIFNNKIREYIKVELKFEVDLFINKLQIGIQLN